MMQWLYAHVYNDNDEELRMEDHDTRSTVIQYGQCGNVDRCDAKLHPHSGLCFILSPEKSVDHRGQESQLAGLV